MKILTILEHDNHHFATASLNTVTAAKAIGENITCLVAGYQCVAVVEQASQIDGVKNILHADVACYQHFLAESMADLILEIAGDYDYLLAPATTFGKNIMPRVAALLDVGQISDITQVIDAETFVRPIYAGNALATVKSLDAKKVITVRPTGFAAAQINASQQAPVQAIDYQTDKALSSFINTEASASERPQLADARIVISGGRGLGSAENFKLIEALADRLGAAVGASRAAVDAGFVPNDFQVGQTGKVVAPELYIAVGISGAIQHVAGMKDSKVIVAINKDADAPIFQIADYGLVGDLFKILPEFEAALQSKL